jgi:mannosyl-oligosaccharide alpha-1,2-mannosidase
VIPKTGKHGLTQGGMDADPSIEVKREFVKQMMKDAWDDYERYAWGENELKPVSKTGHTGSIFGDSKIGATIVDSLDSLYIMGLTQEYQAGRDWVAENLNFDTVSAAVSVFETNIRFMGGLLSAYAFTGDEMYKEKAHQLGKRLLPAFNSPSGLPYAYINLTTGLPPNPDGQLVLAELGTLHLEFYYLSEITGDPIYKEKVDKVREVLKLAVKPNGLYWNFMSATTGEFVREHVSIGALGDSFYEYLLKAYIQLGDNEARQMYDEAMNAFVANDLVRVSKPSHLMYIAEWDNGQVNDIVGHLACFAGGMFALGSHVDPRPPGTPERERDMEIGKNFTNTCHESYIRSASRIGPEIFRFTDGLEAITDRNNEKGYILRPEVVESYFILFRLTGDTKYRDWGWDAALALQKYCKAGPGRGYSGLRDVYSENPTQDDVQQSFFLAETLKYLYLLFSSNDLISLDEWVFNTECHPLPVKATNPLY